MTRPCIPSFPNKDQTEKQNLTLGSSLPADLWRAKSVYNGISVLVPRRFESRSLNQNAAGCIVEKLVAATLDDRAFIDSAMLIDF